MKIATAVITAPRKQSTLDQSIKSLVKAGLKSPVIIAEPNSNLSDYIRQYQVIENIEKLGTFGNWINAVKYLYENFPLVNYYCICEDDVIYNKTLLSKIRECPLDAKLISLYTCATYEDINKSWFQVDKLYGTLCTLFSRTTAKLIIDKSSNWRGSETLTVSGSERKGQDTYLSELLDKIYCYGTSFCQHIGEESTINSGGMTDLRKSKHFENKKISIIIAARNNGQYLQETIQSALNQSVKCQVIYSDDCSYDNSVAIAQAFAEQIIVLQSNKHLGVCEARNYGFEASNGDYLVFLDGDDVLPIDYIEKHLQAMTPSTPFVYGTATAFGEGDRAGSHWTVPDWDVADIWKQNSCNTSSMYQRTAFLAAGKWRNHPEVNTSWDWDLALRCMRYGTPRPSEADLKHRQHFNSWSVSYELASDESCKQIRYQIRKANAKLSIGCIISGRIIEILPQWMTQLTQSLTLLNLPDKPELIIIDNSDYRSTIQSETEKYSNYFSIIKILRNSEKLSWNSEIERRNKVSTFLANSYNTIWQNTQGDVIWLLEDDILLSKNHAKTLYDYLLFEMPNAVCGAYRNRHARNQIVGGYKVGTEYIELTKLRNQPFVVDYSGTGCLMFWRDRCPKIFNSHHENIPAHDWAWSFELKKNGGKLVMIPSVKCLHVQSKSDMIEV